MLKNQRSRDLQDRLKHIEFARAGIHRQLARLQDGSKRPLNLHDAVAAALEICSYEAGYVAATASEPRQGLDAETGDLFRTSAHDPWEAGTDAATDLARLLGGFIAIAADHLDLSELNSAVPLLRAALFVQARRHFEQDCDLNPPLIQHWCDGLNMALEQGEPSMAILCLRALRDRLLSGTDVKSGPPTAGGSDDLGDDWRHHDPGPSSDDPTDAQHVSGTKFPFAHVPGASENDAWPAEYELVIERGVPIPILEEEEVLARVSRQRDDLLLHPETDPLWFAQVAQRVRRLNDSIARTTEHNGTIRRAMH